MAADESASEWKGRIRLRRSVLIAPGDNTKLLAKMSVCGADVCILDWEDGVLPHRKAAARDITTEALRQPWRCPERVVRTNAMSTEYIGRDIAAAVATGCDSIMLPKVETAADVERADAMISAAEKACGREPGSVEVWALIETVHAVLNLEAIAAGPRMTAMIFGGGDLGADLRLKRIQLGANRTLGMMRYEYVYAFGRFVAAARAAGIDPVNVGFTSYADLEGTREDAEISAQFGFTGALAISPRQIDVLNEVFSPSADDMRWSDEVLTAVDKASGEDKAVVVVDGSMIDGPFIRSARYMRELHDLITAHEAAGR